MREQRHRTMRAGAHGDARSSMIVAMSWAWAAAISKATIGPFAGALPKMREALDLGQALLRVGGEPRLMRADAPLPIAST